MPRHDRDLSGTFSGRELSSRELSADPNIIRLVPSRRSDIGISTWAFWLSTILWLLVVIAVYGGWSWL